MAKVKIKVSWQEIVFWIAVIALIIMIATRLFGESPTEIQIYTIIIIITLAIISYIMKMNREIGEIKIEMKHLSINVKDGFNKVREDINKLQKRGKNKMAEWRDVLFWILFVLALAILIISFLKGV